MVGAITKRKKEKRKKEKKGRKKRKKGDVEKMSEWVKIVLGVGHFNDFNF